MTSIIDFENEHQPAFKALNYEWLNKYFAIEPIDEKVLSNPKDEIIATGGKIFCAKLNNEIIGTVALIKRDDHYELSKMAVTEKYQGLGIGALLMEHIIQWTKAEEIPYLLLYSHSKLTRALKLYEKFGFQRTTIDNPLYKRADVIMELNLTA